MDIDLTEYTRFPFTQFKSQPWEWYSLLLMHPPSQTHRMEHRIQLQLPVHATLHWQWTRILQDLLASSRYVQKGLQIFLTASYHQPQELKDGSCMTSLSDCAQMKLACNKLRLAFSKYAFLVGGIASKPRRFLENSLFIASFKDDALQVLEYCRTTKRSSIFM